MPQTPNPTPLLKIAGLAVVPVALAAALATGHFAPGSRAQVRPPARQLAQLRQQEVPTVPRPAEPGAPEPHSPSLAAAKSAAPTPAPSQNSRYPYPMDALQQVARGQLELSWAPSSAGATRELVVAIPSGGWIPGQPVFLFWARQFQAVAAPGDTVQLQAPPSVPLSPQVEVFGFQFPRSNPLAPIAAFGSAPVPPAP
jgi:hypothetical protein